MDTRHARLTDDLARGIFTGRVAIWGAVVPLGCLVCAWCGMLTWGSEDMALAFGARWGSAFALWLFGIVLAIAARWLVRVALSARRRRSHIAAVHAALARKLGREEKHSKRQRDPLATAAMAVVVAMILALAAPATCPPSRTPLWDFFGASLLVAGIAGAFWKMGHHIKTGEARRRFEKWKALRESRREGALGRRNGGKAVSVDP